MTHKIPDITSDLTSDTTSDTPSLSSLLSPSHLIRLAVLPKRYDISPRQLLRRRWDLDFPIERKAPGQARSQYLPYWQVSKLDDLHIALSPWGLSWDFPRYKQAVIIRQDNTPDYCLDHYFQEVRQKTLSQYLVERGKYDWWMSLLSTLDVLPALVESIPPPSAA